MKNSNDRKKIIIAFLAVILLFLLIAFAHIIFVTIIGLVLTIIMFIGIVIYLVPSLLAILRHNQKIGVIALINIFLGWSIIGWIVALVMSLSSKYSPTYSSKI